MNRKPGLWIGRPRSRRTCWRSSCSSSCNSSMASSDVRAASLSRNTSCFSAIARACSWGSSVSRTALSAAAASVASACAACNRNWRPETPATSAPLPAAMASISPFEICRNLT
eukprot:scaffold652_cov100-Isochrysis_galbana.AAC.4